jgi:hypothetical protein
MTQTLLKRNMAKLSCTQLILCSLSFMFGQQALAQDNVAIASNAVQIEQIGATNLALITADAQNNVFARQNGQGNNVALTIDGVSNGDELEPLDLIQTGQGNRIAAQIIGDENRLSVVQNSDGASNEAIINQDGQFNSANITQDAAGLSEGLANYAELNQIGQNNSADISQTAFASGASLFNNDILINQTGDDNFASSTQSGVNNRSEQEQVGDRNRSEIIQTGNDNLAIHRQFGNDLSVPSEFGGIVIEQTGGASILVEQYSADVAPLPQ